MALSDFFGSLGGGVRRGSEFLSGLMQPQKPTFEDSFNLPEARSFELPKHATLPIANDPMGGKQSSALRELLALSQNAPQREEPGGWRKLAGFLSGLGTSTLIISFIQIMPSCFTSIPAIFNRKGFPNHLFFRR